MQKLKNWLGLNLFKCVRKISRPLFVWANSLNPHNELIKKSLLVLGMPYQKTRQDSYESLSSVAAECKLLKQKIHFFHVDQYVNLSKPKVLNSDFEVSPLYETTAQLPNTYLAELDNVLVFGGTDLIVSHNDTILYDELALTDRDRYTNKSPVVKFISDDFIVIEKNASLLRHIKKGIHFTKDHSSNYFHWLVECLPRLLLVNQLPELNNVPLLVDENISLQQREALNFLNEDNREIITIRYKKSHFVEKLFYPSQLSVIHDNMKSPVQHNKDVYYSPLAVNFVRNFFLQKLKVSHESGLRKLYVSRNNAQYRKLINAEEIEELMLSQGFEIIFPERLTFAGQVKLFSQAKMVVGQTGAGMANLLFVPKDCQVLIFSSDDKQTNLHIFNALCDQIGVDAKFLIGKTASHCEGYSMHSDFTVDTKLLMNYLSQ